MKYCGLIVLHCLSQVSATCSVFLLVIISTSTLSGTPLALSAQAVSETSDGMQTSYFKITGRGFEGRRFSEGNWVLSDSPGAGASLSFYHRFGPDVFMHFGVFSGSHLIKNYEENELRRYLASLIGHYAKDNYEIVEPVASKAPDGIIPFMGGRYWRIRYKLADRDTNSIVMHVLEYLSLDEQDRNFRLQFIGPPEDFLRLEAGFERERSKFM